MQCPLNLTQPIWKMLVGKPLMLEDFETADVNGWEYLLNVLDNDLINVGYHEETYTLHHGVDGNEIVAVLKEGFENVKVNDENKYEYLKLRMKYLLFDCVSKTFENILIGFYSVIPKNLVTSLQYSDLQNLVCINGLKILDWKKCTIVETSGFPTDTIDWFWEIMESDSHLASKVFQYVTKSFYPPPGGCGALDPPFKIRMNGVIGDPILATCKNSLILYPFESREGLENKLRCPKFGQARGTTTNVNNNN